MNIKDIEKELSVSRSNIRFYEKAGLLSPERRENNYRDYSQEDLAVLKKILILRKLGFTVEEISLMQKGELSIGDAAQENICRLESEIASMKAALEMTKDLSSENPSFDTLDQERLWNKINESEKNGQKFFDICKDYVMFELNILDTMLEYNLFFDFKDTRKRYGILKACGILFLLCIIRGIGSVVIWQESFWEGFLYPLVLFVGGSIVILPLYILRKKAPKVACVVAGLLLILCILLLAACFLLIIYGIVRKIFG